MLLAAVEGNIMINESL